MIKIYKIEAKDLSKINNILEAPEKMTGELDIELEKEAGKTSARKEKAKVWEVNEFKRNGYLLREAAVLGKKEKASYLYINAAEDFFERNEKKLLDNGAKSLSGEEYNEIKKKIEELENAATEGFGSLFG